MHLPRQEIGFLTTMPSRCTAHLLSPRSRLIDPMHSKDLLLIANRQAAAAVFPALEDLKSAPLISPAPHCPNHAHWIVGHLIFSEGRYREMTLGVPNPSQSMQAMFGGGSKPCL